MSRFALLHPRRLNHPRNMIFFTEMKTSRWSSRSQLREPNATSDLIYVKPTHNNSIEIVKHDFSHTGNDQSTWRAKTVWFPLLPMSTFTQVTRAPPESQTQWSLYATRKPFQQVYVMCSLDSFIFSIENWMKTTLSILGRRRTVTTTMRSSSICFWTLGHSSKNVVCVLGLA